MQPLALAIAHELKILALNHLQQGLNQQQDKRAQHLAICLPNDARR